MSITYTSASGVDIERIARKIETIAEGERIGHIVMACMVIALTFQHPDIEIDDLIEGVKGATEWITCFLGPLDGGKDMYN